MPSFTRRTITALAAMLVLASPVAATEPLRVYGPGGPLPAMKEAAAVFAKAHGIEVQVVAGPLPGWQAQAKADADLVFSGSEAMMSDFVAALPEIDPTTVTPLYLRPAAILVRPGNPGQITGIRDLLKPGHRILVVNGAGQQGLWEDVVGRLGRIADVKAFRTNIAVMARNSAEARQTWSADPSLDAWLIWSIWQVANPALADQVAVEPELRIYRDTGIALTRKGATRPQARAFAAYLASPEAERIFVRWGWTPAEPEAVVSTPR